MDIARARYLASPAGRAALAELPPAAVRADPNKLVSALRKSYPPAEASALSEQAILIARASARFGNAQRAMLLTGPGLEMMTHPAIARRRAERLTALGLPIADLTCGLGGDLGPCTAGGLRAVGVERDRATAILARANIPAASLVVGDAARPPLHIEEHAIILDPSRREGARRTFDPAAFSPGWDTCLALASTARAAVLKAPPGIDHARIPASAEMEAVQFGAGLREITIWSGAGAQPGLRRAVLLPAGAFLTSVEAEAPPETVPAGVFVFDPESCVTRAGLVRHLGHRLGARMLDEQVAYLTADTPSFDPMAATFEVLEVTPFSVRRLKETLRAHHWRPAEIRRRAFPIEPDDLLRLLGRIEGEEITLLCTTIAGARTVIVARRIRPPSSPTGA